jgi:hypothetical protein
MVSLTLSVTEELKEKMDRFPEMNWSEIARESIKRRIDLLIKFKEFTKNSSFTEEDALRLGREVSRKVAERHKK